MLEIHNPSVLADAIELDLERYRAVASTMRVPEVMADRAEALERVSVMLRRAAARRQTVDVSEDILRVIAEFRESLRAGGAAAHG